MELEEAIKNVKDEINVDKNNLPIAEANEYEEERTLMLNRIEAKETILNHLTKQEKMIDEMIKVMSDRNICKYFIENYCKHYAGENKKTCDVCIKQYFENKANEEE